MKRISIGGDEENKNKKIGGILKTKGVEEEKWKKEHEE